MMIMKRLHSKETWDDYKLEAVAIGKPTMPCSLCEHEKVHKRRKMSKKGTYLRCLSTIDSLLCPILKPTKLSLLSLKIAI